MFLSLFSNKAFYEKATALEDFQITANKILTENKIELLNCPKINNLVIKIPYNILDM